MTRFPCGPLPVILLSLFIPLCAAGKSVTDTLVSAGGDRLIISYDISRRGDKATLMFSSCQKKLGDQKKNSDLRKIVALIFDRRGRYDEVRFEGISPEAFMIPANVEYEKTPEGFCLLQSAPFPVFTFNLTSGEGAGLSMPVYLAEYKKKGRYKIFASCGNLEIDIPADAAALRQRAQEARSPAVSVSTETIDSEHGDVMAVLACIERVQALLAEQDRLPLSESLVYDINELRGFRNKINQPELSEKISAAIDQYEAKKQELKKAEERTAKEAEEKREKARMEEAEKAEEKAQAQAAETRKRNVWMIGGGVLLAILLFAGNQTMQHFRNLSSQKRMMEMQQSAVRQAENDAKRRAASLARSKTKKAVNTAVRRGKEAAVRKKPQLTFKKKNLKKITI